MDAVLVAVPLLAGGAVGLLAYLGLSRLSQIRGRASEPLSPAQRFEQIGDFLESVPVPGPIERSWGDEESGRMLILSGVPWSPHALSAARWLALWFAILLGVGTLLLQGGLMGWFLALILFGLGWQGLPMWLRLRIDQRRQEVDRALPDFLDRLTLGLEAGLGFEVALRRTAGRFASLLGDELRRAVRFLDRGHPKSEVLDDLVARTPSNDLRAFVASVKQSDRLGTSLTKTLRVQSDLLRGRRRRRAEEASRRLPILIVFPLVFFFLPALLIIYLSPPLLHLFLGG